MDAAALNNMIKQFKTIRLEEFSESGISSTRLEDDSVLYANITDNTVMFFKPVEKLGEKAEETPRVFTDLLAAGMCGGRFGNIRITYDVETTYVWICIDVLSDNLTADKLEETAALFIKHSPQYIKVLRSVIANAFFSEGEDSAENTAPEQVSVKPEQTLSEMSIRDITSFLSI